MFFSSETKNQFTQWFIKAEKNCSVKQLENFIFLPFLLDFYAYLRFLKVCKFGVFTFTFEFKTSKHYIPIAQKIYLWMNE